MNLGEAARFWGIPQQKIQAPSGASPHMQALIEALNARPHVFKERETIKNVKEPLDRLKSAPAEEQLAFVFEALAALGTRASMSLHIVLKGVISHLLRTGLPLNSLHAFRMVELSSNSSYRFHFPYKALLSSFQNVTMTPALKDALLQLRQMVGEHHGMDEIQERIDVLVHGAKEKPAAAVSGWSRHVFQEIEASGTQIAWRRLLLHARSLTQSSASSKWKKDAVECVESIGRAEFLEAAARWLALGPMPGMAAHLQVPDDEADYQKGFIWTLGAVGDASMAAGIADFAFACFRKIPQIGAVSHRVGNACVNALAAMPGLDAVTQISRLGMRVKYDVARRLIEKALEEAAERNHVGRDDLEAMSVPSFGLDSAGVRIEVLGGCEARLAVEEGTAVLSWWREGKPLKAAPAEVKSNHAAALADLKKAAKELQAVLSTQRLRLERQLLSQSACLFERWQDWYLNHPVTSAFTKRLIWEIQTGDASQTAMWGQGGMVNWAGDPVTVAPTSTVRLWHPIRAQVQEVLSWRCWLEDHGIRQPFKQAHREVYLLTDAERETGTYSNRFAGHIVRQHQFSALCRERGWQFKLMGEWDSHNTPQLELPQYNLRAEFDVDFSEGAEVSGHMVYSTIGTERMQFFPMEAKRGRFELRPSFRPLRLADIPAVVFSEVMRDADLLVGVTSIGTDPEWGADHPDEHAEYWHRFADAELSIAAEMRRSVLESLLPKLTIRDRCRITDRYLWVRGESNEYRIHLGSGNVLMEPGSQYLCIVRGGGDTAATVPLPFEGDSMLAVILSKAFLLANDKAIRDGTILRQIRR
ncbi:MAG: DUF4132 domain-containing protein [Bryobacteraceae bacterium]